ncbi:hypothetical protein OKA05_20000 [Luteolibacter arcticus]|uniref:Uncharacterized protein n=1 Tax=Luteolibacter arcticus TaxID=1581411 RepID=A0ABT3GMV6_9BACT|nr:hypothetical protein [Luteolibacter arcticus]MCW1924856.1 hypothetical protein [Luteolibacter arcticus]
MSSLPEAWLATPRKFPLRDRLIFLRVVRPDWMESDDLAYFFENHRRVLTHGRLVLAAVIQANRTLYDPQGPDAPGEIVYDFAGEMGPVELLELALRLKALRDGGAADPRAARIGDYLAKFTERVFGWPIPEGWGPETCRISSVYFPRHHLWGCRLAGKILPVCVDPETGVAVVFPAKYLSAE